MILANSTADPRDPLGELGVAGQDGGEGRRAAPPEAPAPRLRHLHRQRQGRRRSPQLAKKHKADVVIFDNDLSPGQIGALEKIINEEAGSKRGERGIKVLDRSELILDIFATRAQTHEAKLQVELAQMQYTYPRLAQMWGHLERIAGSGGGHGHRHARPGRNAARNRPPDRPQAHLRPARPTSSKIQERKSRLVAQRNREHFTVCIVGYTNAGKSTLFNTLTAAGTYADDKLFATLDTKTRAWKLERGTEVLLSDTVGFVRDLPHNLVASLQGDAGRSGPRRPAAARARRRPSARQQQFESVHKVLEEIGVEEDKPEILLLNKIDTEEGEEHYPFWRTLHPDAIPISAKTGHGLDKLHEAVYQAVRGQQVDVTLEADVTNGRLISFIESHSRVHDRQFIDGRVQIKAVMGKRTLADLSRNEQVEVQKVESLT